MDYLKYENRGVTWYMEHQDEIAMDLSQGEPGAAMALIALLDNLEGASSLKRFMDYHTMELSSEEIWTLYSECCGGNIPLFAAAIGMLPDLDPAQVHANLQVKNPINLIASNCHSVSGDAPKLATGLV